MKAYHIDRLDLLSPGMNIDLQKQINGLNDKYLQAKINQIYPEGLSQYGNLMYTAFNGDSSVRAMENIIELERRLNYPDKLSRFQSIFALKHLSDVDSWLKEMNTQKNNLKIFEIDFDHSNFLELDSRLLISDIDYYCPINFHTNLQLYWSEHVTNNPLLELIIKPPIKVTKLIEAIT